MGQAFEVEPLDLDYDQGADVLYLSLGRPRPDEGEDRPGGIVLRYGADDDRPSGVTVIGFVENGWSNNLDDFAKIAASHLSIPHSDVIMTIKNVKW